MTTSSVCMYQKCYVLCRSKIDTIDKYSCLQTSHAKGEQDGEGGTVKGGARRYVYLGATTGVTIENAREFADFINKHLSKPKHKQAEFRVRTAIYIDALTMKTIRDARERM